MVGGIVRTEFDPDQLGADLYPLLNSIVVPRPIAWVSSRSADGVLNLAPHSYFTVASVAPPIVSFTSVGTKDTLRNVRATGEFVVHVVTRELAEHANVSGFNWAPEEDEIGLAGLTTEAPATGGVPRVAEARAVLECTLDSEHAFAEVPGFPASVVVFGRVRHIAVDTAVLADDGYADLRLLAPVSRLGRNDWADVGELFALQRIDADAARASDDNGRTAARG